MPLYEYICNLCRRPFTVLVGVTAASDNSACPHCGSLRATRRITRFARIRSEDHIIDGWVSSGKQLEGDDAYGMRKWAGDLGNAVGEDLGEDFEEYLDAADAPDEDEKP